MTTILKITGMTCQGCVASVSRALHEVAGVRAVEVSLEQGVASVDFDPAQVEPGALAEVVEAVGFEVLR